MRTNRVGLADHGSPASAMPSLTIGRDWCRSRSPFRRARRRAEHERLRDLRGTSQPSTTSADVRSKPGSVRDAVIGRRERILHALHRRRQRLVRVTIRDSRTYSRSIPSHSAPVPRSIAPFSDAVRAQLHRDRDREDAPIEVVPRTDCSYMKFWSSVAPPASTSGDEPAPSPDASRVRNQPVNTPSCRLGFRGYDLRDRATYGSGRCSPMQAALAN